MNTLFFTYTKNGNEYIITFELILGVILLTPVHSVIIVNEKFYIM